MVVLPFAPGPDSFYQALLSASYTPYLTGYRDNQVVSKEELVLELRGGLLVALSTPGRDGAVAATARELGHEYRLIQPTLAEMLENISQGHPVTPPYWQFISNQIGHDLYVVDAGTGSLVVTGDERYLHQGRSSIILARDSGAGGGYHLVGCLVENNRLLTHFRPDHPLIALLRAKAGLVEGKA
jgi:hypothetical protein